MTVEELIARARARTDDTVSPYLVSDEDLVAFANEAQNQACERALLLHDYTSTLCSFTTEAAVAAYPLDRRILAVTRASVDGSHIPLEPLNTHDSYLYQVAQSLGAGRPQALHNTRGHIVGEATPDAEKKGSRIIYRYPLKALTETDQVPEIPAVYHEKLVDWMVFRAFGKWDVELYNKSDRDAALAAFQVSFGEPRSARELESWRELPRDLRVRMVTP